MSNHEETVKSALYMCLKVTKMYEWLLNLYVLDFFVDNHWIKLPTTWQQCFGDMDPKDLGDIISGKTNKNVLPLSFLALLKAVNSFSIPRKGSNISIMNDNYLKGMSHIKLNNLYLKHVKLKKRHEISLMSDFVYSTAIKSKCNAVMDFGSGLGHLVRILNYKYDLTVLGIEMQTQLTEEARKLDLELEYTAKKHLTEECMSKLQRPTHFNITLTSLDQLQEIELPNIINNYGLIGLHPCGDLGPLLIKHFVNCDKVKFICVVGCCYMKLSCNTDVNCGYPMSKYVNQLDNSLTYVSREIACHAIELYTQKLCKGDYKDLKVHAYRAALEKLLVELDPKLKHMPIRSVKHTNDMSFESYCEAAQQRLHVNSLLRKGVENDLNQWKRVVVMYTLRLMMAPLVETVILLDRLLYILEHGISCAIYPVFDPKISPRNHIIVGIKS